MTAHASAAPGLARDFEIVTRRKNGDRWLNQASAYSVAIAFVRGEIDVHGDLIAAARYQIARTHKRWQAQILNAFARWQPWQITQRLTTKTSAARNIRFHYDRSNDFYRLFLDSQMVYSCAYFERPDASLDQAQAAKLDLICRKLLLHPGDRFLDLGCGWGALAMHAARRYGAVASGCTLSHRQYEHACARIHAEQLDSRVFIREMDYRDVTGEFDRISSVGMFEHVGRVQLEAYFRRAYALLAPGGLFLNHGITRPHPVASDAQSMFIARKVFPGGQIVRLEDVVNAAERAGFEVLDVENLRLHYARTCRNWVERLVQNREACLKTVDEQTWRTWQLYLAGSSLAFEDGDLGLHQVLLAKRGANGVVPPTREYMYAR